MPSAHQSHLISLLLTWTGERKHNKRFMGQYKGREGSPLDCGHGQNRLYCQSNQSRIMININLNNPSTYLFFLPNINSQIFYLSLSVAQGLGKLLPFPFDIILSSWSSSPTSLNTFSQVYKNMSCTATNSFCTILACIPGNKQLKIIAKFWALNK